MRKNYKEIFDNRLNMISNLTGIPIVPDQRSKYYVRYEHLDNLYYLLLIESDCGISKALNHKGSRSASGFEEFLDGLIKGLEFKR